MGFLKEVSRKKIQKNSGLLPNPPLTPNLQFNFFGINKMLTFFFFFSFWPLPRSQKNFLVLGTLAAPSPVFFLFCVLKKCMASWTLSPLSDIFFQGPHDTTRYFGFLYDILYYHTIFAICPILSKMRVNFQEMRH